MKKTDLQIIGIEEGEFRSKGTEDIFNKIIKEKFSKYKERDAHQGARNKLNTG